MIKFRLTFEFDVWSEPPLVFISDENGIQILEVFEKPVKNNENWEGGPIAKKLVTLMNSFSNRF